VNFDHEFKIGGLHLDEGLVAQHARIVDQHMHAAPLLLGVGNHLFHLFVFGDRPAIGDRLAAHRFDLGDDLRRGVRRAGAIARSAEVVDHHLGAAPREFERIGLAQTAAGTGDDGNLVLEADGHACSPVVDLCGFWAARFTPA